MKASRSTRRRSISLSFLLLLTFIQPQQILTKASALSVGSSTCLQDVDTTTAVSVTTSGSNCVLTFNFSGTTTIWTVPSLGLSDISFTIKGSKGGGSVPDAGNGAAFSGVIPSLPGSTQVYINVGGVGTSNGSGLTGGGFNGGGAGGYNGGTGGGGATDIRIGSNSASNRKIVAGGGGGSSGVSATFVNGSNANGATGGTAGTAAACTGSVGQNASAGGAGGASTCRNAGGGGGGYAGGGGAGNNANGSNNGGRGGSGSSYWDGTFASINTDCGNGCTFWNNGSSNTNFDYSKYTNNAAGSLVLTFAPNVSSVINAVTASGNAVFRMPITLSATVNLPAFITFRANNKKIPGCIRRLATGSGNSYSATCSWTPSLRGTVVMTATAVPVDGAYLSSTTPARTFLVGNRTGRR